MAFPMKQYQVEKIPQYKSGDMIVLTKFKPELGFHDDEHNPRLNIPYMVDHYDPMYPTDQGVISVVFLSRSFESTYNTFGGWWIPIDIIQHAKTTDELIKFINDKVKAVKGA